MYNSLSVGGRVSMTEILQMCRLQNGFEPTTGSTKTILLVKVNNWIIYFAFGLIIILLVLQAK